MKEGKLEKSLLKKIVFKNLGVMDRKIVVEPRVGFDSCVLEYDDENYLVVSSDPVVGVPEKYLGFFSFHYSASDVAVFGAKPRWLSVTILMPKSTKKEFLSNILEQLNREAEKHGACIVGGHTGVYPSIKTTTITSTCMGLVKKHELITPEMAEIGDKIVLTKYLGLELACALAHKYNEEDLKSLIFEETTVKDAMIGKKYASSMHDVTEGGLISAMNEIAECNKLGFVIYQEKIEIPDRILEVFKKFRINPLSASSTGCLLITTKNSRKLIKEFERKKIFAREIGEICEKGRFLIKNGRKKNFPKRARDFYSKLIY